MFIEKPKVSVCVITYNQDKYIRRCLQSIVEQKTSFSFEIIIGDDCSTDKTREIIGEFKNRYQNIVRPIFRNNNIGPKNNFFDVLSAANGQYLAFCEGDDYWTDQLKLQKQLEFMENKQDYSMCYHAVEVVDIQGHRTGRRLGPYKKGSRDYPIEFNVIGGNVHVSSVLTRAEYIKDGMPPWYTNAESGECGDFALALFLSASGKTHFIDESMSAHRDGVKGSLMTEMRNKYSRQNEIDYHKKRIATLESADRYYNYAFHDALEEVNLHSLVKILMLEGNKEELKKDRYREFLNRQGRLRKFKLIILNKHPNIAKIMVRLKGHLMSTIERVAGSSR